MPLLSPAPTPSTPGTIRPIVHSQQSKRVAVPITPVSSAAPLAPSHAHGFEQKGGLAPSLDQLPSVFADESTMPTTPWTAHTASTSFYLADDLEPPVLPSPSFASGFRCSSEPPINVPMINSRTTRSRSVSRTPSLPASNDSRSDLKSLPVTPKVEEQVAFLPDQMLPTQSAPVSPFQSRHPMASAPTTASVQASRTRGDSAPVTPSTHSAALPFGAGHGHSLSHSGISPPNHHFTHAFAQQQAAALRSSQYTDLFLLEPHEYDSITDGEFVRLYNRGLIDGRVLEQIVDASIRIQRACTDADRAVSIKTRRAMIRQALEE